MEPSFQVQDQICQRFSLDQIRSATQDFDEALVVGSGGFGKVYKGQINDGSSTIVAIKRSNSTSDQGATQFQAEIQMLSKVRHCNLVSLIGYCYQGTEMALVYEYMPEGTLEDHLHKSGARLSWLQLLKICIGAARGLDYLHTGTGTQHGIIHRDVKSSNVLLDKNFAAKISDFGLAKIGPTNQTRTHVSTMVKGTFGYLDPCYVYTGKLTRKSDVYSFGVVLLEVICGRPAVDTSLDEDQWGLAPWAQARIKEGKRNHIVDLRLRGQISSNCLKGFIGIASQCLHNQPNQRPKMAEIVTRLEVLLSLQDREGSSIAEGKFKGKVWSFFQAKVESKDTEAPNGTLVGGSESRGLPAGASSGLKGITVDKPVEFSYEELSKATDDFNLANKIGQGGFGAVFYAELRGEKAAIKKMDMQASREFLAELKFLTHVHHLNLVRLIGYCVEGSLFLVYEYFENGNLSQHLHGSARDPLPWSTRVQIALDSARGLEYIHEHTVPVYIHRDIKPASILIDKNFHGKVAGFGLTKLTEVGSTSFPTRIVGTFGYMSPEYVQYGDLSPKVDVYAFGVVLYELISAKEAIVEANDSVAESKGLVALFEEVLSQPDPKDDLVKMIDPRLEDNYPLDSVRKMAQLAKACTHENPQLRPSMRSIVVALVTLSSTTEG